MSKNVYITKLRFFQIIGISPTDNLEIVWRASRSKMKELHPDNDPSKKKEWEEFEPVWASIREQSKNGGKTFIFPSDNSKNDEKPKSAKREQPKKEDTKRSTHKHEPKRGSDIVCFEDINFDEIVSGCQKTILVPFQSALKDQITVLKYTVTPTPLGIDREGRVSKQALSNVRNKKVVIPLGGHPGINGGVPGDLIIKFRVDTSKTTTIQDALNEFHKTNYVNQSRSKSVGDSAADISQVKPNVQPNGKYPSHKRQKFGPGKQFLLGFLLLCVWLGVRIYNSNMQDHEKNNAFQICQYISTLNQSIVDNFFADESNPWRAALDSGYFAPDPNNSEETAGFQDEGSIPLPDSFLTSLHSLQDPRYDAFVSDYLNFTRTFAKKDVSYGKFAENLNNDCDTLGKQGGLY